MQSIQVFQSRRFAVERLTYTTSTGTPLQRDVVRHPGSVAIVPVLDDGRICLIKNRRMSVDQTLLEIPAGTMEPPEPPLECAYRELREETGFRAGQMELVTSFYPAPGILDEVMHLFIARKLTPGRPQLEPDEQIENVIASRESALAWLVSGKICDAKTMVGLFFLNQMEDSK